MKKIFLSLLSFVCIVSGAWALTEIQDGVYIGNFKFNGSSISYTMKIESHSDLWAKYAAQQNIPMDSYGYMNGDFNINCSTGAVKGNVFMYDNFGNQLGEFTTLETPNQQLAAMCAMANFTNGN